MFVKPISASPSPRPRAIHVYSCSLMVYLVLDHAVAALVTTKRTYLASFEPSNVN